MSPAAVTGSAIGALLLNAAVWGASWWPFRQLDALGLHSLWATALAMLIGVVALLAYRPAAFGDCLRSPTLWAVAAAAGLTNSCFNWAVSLGPVVRVVLLFYLMPVWSILFARLLLGEPLGVGALLRVALALCGAAIVLWTPDTGLPLPASLADWLGTIGGIGMALTNVSLRLAAGAGAAGRSMALFGGSALAAAGVAAAVAATGGPVRWPAFGEQAVAMAALAGAGGGAFAWAAVPGPGWLPGALLLSALLLFANGALQYGASRLPAGITAVVMLFEIVVAAVTAAWIGGEPLSTRTLLGGALILVTTLWSALAAAQVAGGQGAAPRD